MAGHRTFTLSQIAQHKSKKDCWIVIDGRVLDVTKFLEEHPGGEEVLTKSAGKDATKEFKDIGHSRAAQDSLVKYQVGVLQGHSVHEAGTTDVLLKESKNKEMRAFVIKDDLEPKSSVFLEFVVPLFVACSYFSYRYITTIKDQMTY